MYEQSDVPIDGWSIECRVYAEVRIEYCVMQSARQALTCSDAIHF